MLVVNEMYLYNFSLFFETGIFEIELFRNRKQDIFETGISKQEFSKQVFSKQEFSKRAFPDFFNSSYDENTKYIISIDFSHLGSSLITDMDSLFSGYNTKDDFFLRQASSECQVAVIEADIIDNGDKTLTLTNPKTIAISKNDNEYHGIVKEEFPQKKQVDALKDMKETLSDLMTSQASSVEDYLSSINKVGMPYGDYETYYARRKK